MAEEKECQLRRRRSSANPNLPLNLEVGFQVNEGGPSQGTPSPSCFKHMPNSTDDTSDSAASSALREFRMKQQSFDIQIEECEEEEIVVDSDDDAEGEGGLAAGGTNRPITPTPIQDFAANVVYTEGPQTMDFLKVKAIEHECVTDVSDADTDGEE